jgi:glycosyltransferase involved in cell wall biosynthesis
MTKDNIKTIGYVSFADPFHDRKAWSGTIYKLRESIENAGYKVVWIPFREDTLGQRIINKLLRVYNKLCGKRWLSGMQFIPFVKLAGRTIDKGKLKQCDILFLPEDAQVLLWTGIDKPYIYHSDATAHLMVGYYWQNINPKSIRQAELLEESASQHAVMNLRSSQWAIDSVIKDCGVASEKCHVLEFGPNLDMKDIVPCDPYIGGKLRVFFSGVDWKRKGGEIAVDTIRELRKRGIDANITIVGILKDKLPKDVANLDFVTCVGFLNKNNSDEYHKYVELFHNSHILILPTIAECSAIVYSEAANFGTPCYTHLTGGTANYVVDGLNGRTLPLAASGKDFANAIEHDIRNGLLPKMHDAALRLAHEKLSWEAWSKRFKALCDGLLLT